MHLASGVSVGPYIIERLLGAGGMGEVYRARDGRLGRSVALKILATDLATRDGLLRFEREARAASALNHPNIVHIYDVGETDVAGYGRVHFIAMELVEGETLRKRMAARAPLDELLGLIVQVADAMAKAHGASIVHRDLKPENIMITEDGYAKVLDFGLAKLARSAEGTEDAATEQLVTGSAAVLGTVGYMSPEQAAGRPADSRSDVFALGCILYEAIGGSRPFVGPSAVDVLHQIVHADPPPLPGAPPEIAGIIGRSLAKNPVDRFPSAREFAADLKRARSSLASPTALSSAGGLVNRRPLRWLAPSAAAVLLVGVVAAGGVLWKRKAPLTDVPPPFATVEIERLTFVGDVSDASISPSGRYVAFVRAGDEDALWLREIASGADVPLTSLAKIGLPRFSPDESFIYYEAEEEGGEAGIHRIPTIGGRPQRIVSGEGGVAFHPNGDRFVFRRRRNGSSEIAATDLDGANESVLYRGPEVFFAGLTWWRDDEIRSLALHEEKYPFSLVAIHPSRRTVTLLRELGTPAIWLPDGRGFVVARASRVPANQIEYVAFPGGGERPVTSDLAHYWNVTITGDGATIAATQTAGSTVIWLKRSPDSVPVAITKPITGRADGMGLSWTPEGAIVHGSVDSGVHIRSIDPDTGTQLTLASEPYRGRNILAPSPAVSPDGRTIVYSSYHDGAVWAMDRDGANPKRLTKERFALEPSWSPAGDAIFYALQKPFGTVFKPGGIWRISRAGGTAAPVVKEATFDPQVSLDGTVLLECDGRSGPLRFRLHPVGGGPPRELPVTANNAGRSRCRWSPNGDAVDYVGTDGDLWRQPLAGGAPARVADFPGAIGQWAWSRDGAQLAVSISSSSTDVVLIHDRSRNE